MIPLSMTLSDLWPRFQGHNLFQHRISQIRHEIRAIDTIRTPIGSHIRFIAWWHFRWPWWIPNPVFKVTAFLKWISKRCDLWTKFLQNTNRKPYTVYRIHFQSPSVTSDPDFRVMTFLKSNIEKKRRVLKTTLLFHTNIRNGAVWLPWLTSKRVARVCQHQMSFLLLYFWPRKSTHSATFVVISV